MTNVFSSVIYLYIFPLITFLIIPIYIWKIFKSSEKLYKQYKNTHIFFTQVAQFLTFFLLSLSIYTHTYTRIYTYVYTKDMYLHVHIYVCICMCVYMYTQLCAETSLTTGSQCKMVRKNTSFQYLLSSVVSKYFHHG